MDNPATQATTAPTIQVMLVQTPSPSPPLNWTGIGSMTIATVALIISIANLRNSRRQRDIQHAQLEATREKFRLDLFDKRMKAYLGLRDVVKRVQKRSDITTRATMDDFPALRCDAKLLFGTDVNDILRKLSTLLQKRTLNVLAIASGSPVDPATRDLRDAFSTVANDEFAGASETDAEFDGYQRFNEERADTLFEAVSKVLVKTVETAEVLFQPAKTGSHKVDAIVSAEQIITQKATTSEAIAQRSEVASHDSRVR